MITVEQAIAQATTWFDERIERWTVEFEDELRREGWPDDAVAVWGEVYREKLQPDRARMIAWIRRGGEAMH